MANRSTFVAPDYIIDTFIELVDLPLSQKTNADRYTVLRQKATRTEAEETEYNSLTTTLQAYLFTPEVWNKFQDSLVNMQTYLKSNVADYLTTKQTEWQNTLNQFTDRGTYNPTTTYAKWNTTQYNGETYLSKIADNLGNTPVGGAEDTYWAKIAQKGIQGIQGEKGDTGTGLSFKGAYSETTTYAQNEAVEYLGSLYACKSNGTIGYLPSNETYWDLAVAKGATSLVSTSAYTVTLTETVSNVSFIGTGKILAYNKTLDELQVYVDGILQIITTDYSLNANNTSIDKASGTWSSGEKITFVVRKNAVQQITFNDGQLLDDKSVSINKLTDAIQTTLGNAEDKTTKGQANGYAGLGSDGKVPSGQLPAMNYIPTSEKGAVSGVASLGTDGKVLSAQLPVMNPVDYGRYQAEFGWDGATCSDTISINNVIRLGTLETSGLSLTTPTPDSSETNSYYLGFKFTAIKSLWRLSLLPRLDYTSKPWKLYNSDRTTLLASGTFTVSGGSQYFNVDYNFVAGQTYYLLIDNINSSGTYDLTTTGVSYPFGNVNISVLSAYQGPNLVGSDIAILWPIFKQIVSYVKGEPLSGTVTKTYTPSDIKKWGNAKWTQTATAAGSSVVCDVLDSSDNALKSGATSIADLSDISITTYPSIKLRWTLTRANVADASPTVSNSSVTWEGPLKTDTYIPISDYIVPTGSVASIVTSVLSGYKKIWIRGYNVTHHSAGAGTVDLKVQFNADTGTNYDNYCGPVSQGTNYIKPGLVQPYDGNALRHFELFIDNEFQTEDKRLSGSLFGANATNGVWHNKLAYIDSITLSLSSYNLYQGTRVVIYGIPR